MFEGANNQEQEFCSPSASVFDGQYQYTLKRKVLCERLEETEAYENIASAMVVHEHLVGGYIHMAFVLQERVCRRASTGKNMYVVQSKTRLNRTTYTGLC